MGGPSRVGLFVTGMFISRDPYERELDAFSDGVDALFVDERVGPPSWRQVLQSYLRLPLSAIGANILVTVLIYPGMLLLNRDPFSPVVTAAKSVADRDGIEVHTIKRPDDERIRAIGPQWIALNWLLLVTFLYVWPKTTVATLAVFTAAGVVPVAARHSFGRWPAVATAVLAIGAVGATVVSGLFGWVFALACFGVRVLPVVVRDQEGPDAMIERLQRQCDESNYDQVTVILDEPDKTTPVTRAAREHGIDVPAVHLHRWFEDDERHTPVDIEALPGE